MYNGFPIGCPYCGMQFLLPGPPLPGQTFGCQRCGQAFQPAPMMPGFAPPRPKKKVPWQLLLGVGSGVAAVLMLIVVVVSLLSSNLKPRKVIDTPDAMIVAAKIQIEEAVKARRMIRDLPSLNAAYDRMDVVNTNLENLLFEGVHLQPLTEAEYQAFWEKHQTTTVWEEHEIFAGIPEYPQWLQNQRVARVEEFLRFHNNVTSVKLILRTGIRSLPPPKTAQEQYEDAATTLHREATRTLSRVRKPKDIDVAIAELGELADQFKQLMNKKKALPKEAVLPTAHYPYSAVIGDIEYVRRQLLWILKHRHGENASLKKAIKDFDSAAVNFRFAEPSGRTTP